MVGCVISGLVSGSFYSMGPMFGLDIGLPISQVSLLMSLTVWAGLLFQIPVGLLSDRLDRLTVMSALGFLVMLVSFGIATLGYIGMSVLVPLTVCFGMIFTIYPVAMARAQDNIEKEEIVPVSAALILFFGIGAFFGPIAASFLMSKIGPFGLYYFTAGCGATLGIVVLVSRNKLPSNFEEQVPYIPIPRTSPVISTIDPRGKHKAPYNADEKSDRGGKLEDNS
jgi:MFS family permease